MDFFSFRYRGREADYEDPRREFLVRALGAGLFAAAGPALLPGCASPGAARLPPGRSIYRLRGEIRVDGRPATVETRIGPNASIATGSGSELVFVVGRDAFILRENSRIDLRAATPASGGGGGGDDHEDGGSGFIAGLRAVTGAVLSVFGARDTEASLGVTTPTATIGIRGTGLYVEAEPDRAYICTCYGETLIRATEDPASQERIETSYHEAPRYVLGAGVAGRRIRPAPVINHADMELVLIESLVGRQPPFLGGGFQGY
jgi:hypothetical protein